MILLQNLYRKQNHRKKKKKIHRSFGYGRVSKGKNTKQKIFSTLYSETENERNLHDSSPISDQRSHFIFPENSRTSKVFYSFQWVGALARNRFLCSGCFCGVAETCRKWILSCFSFILRSKGQVAYLSHYQ